MMDATIHSRMEDLGDASYRVFMGGSGSPLVFFHGFEQHPGAASFLKRLAQGRTVLAPEHPGFGQSGGFTDLTDILDLILHYRTWLTPIVAEHGAVDLVGHSLGGMFAAEVAVACPDLVRRLVLVDAYGLWLDDHPMPDPFAIPQKAFDEAKWADPARAPRETNSFEGDAKHYIFYRSQNLGSASKFMWPIPDRGLARRLKHLRVPTLVLHGSDDGLVPPVYAEAWGAAIPGAEVKILRGAGHLPMVETEDAFLEALREFLD
ncbi:alpha/beta fold hydrolase [Tianweitania sediminis]|uniref:Alpha/beta hydrolase n=1 Tax=Tianweitania sediminis TaxID=1502156 RepID=A0A8J7UI67_9HYPH|nr:alpha/beta hydrolase [Tianweitania sediminis]MBP0437354.1 alpha/beta hydrolase [Tianweitania sediminis]